MEIIPIIFKAEDYISRSQLEKDITRRAGNDPNINRVHLIRGNSENLERLLLSERTSVFGIKCEVKKTKKKT